MAVVAVVVDDMAKLMVAPSRRSRRRLLFDVSIVCRCKDVCCCLPTAVITAEDTTVFEEVNAAV